MQRRIGSRGAAPASDPSLPSDHVPFMSHERGIHADGPDVSLLRPKDMQGNLPLLTVSAGWHGHADTTSGSHARELAADGGGDGA
jgi:hypothetical protein